MKLKDKVAIITGAGSGIGRAIALRFAAEGACLVLADQDEASGAETAGLARSNGQHSLAVTTDVSDPRAVERLFRTLDERGWPIDILVNNAGIAQPLGSLQDMTDEAWSGVIEVHRRLIDVHVNGTFYCTREALKRMVPRRSGVIVNMGAVAGLRGGPGVASYSAAKGAIHALSKAVAHEAGPFGIRVNCIAPGFIETPLLGGLPEEWRSLMTQMTPLCRFGAPEEVAAVALFLASQDSSFVVGQLISPNGGLYL